MTLKENRYLPLVAGALIQLCIGIIYIWGIFQKPLVEHFGWSNGAASITFSIMLSTFVLGIVVGGRISDKMGPRLVVFLGGFLFSLGILLTSFIPKSMPELIYLFYGGIAGFGVGAAYTSTISAAQKWWADKRGFATGVIVCTFGASTVVFTPLANYLLQPDVFGVIWTFRFFAILFFAIVMLLGWFVKNPSKEYMSALGLKTPDFANQKQFSPLEVLKTKQYYGVLLGLMFLTPAYFIINPLMKTLGEVRGLSESVALAGVMITGIASSTGRLLAPWASDKIGRKNVIFILYFISFASVLMMTFAQSYLFVVMIALIAFAFGGTAGVFPAFTADYFGGKNIGVNYGLVMIGFAVSGLLFPTVSSLVSKEGNPTALTFVIPAVACLVGSFIVFLLKPPTKK